MLVLAGRTWRSESGRQNVAGRTWQAERGRQDVAGRTRKAERVRQNMAGSMSGRSLGSLRGIGFQARDFDGVENGGSVVESRRSSCERIRGVVDLFIHLHPSK